ncbi:TRANSPARENT TESTA protein 12 [Spatholobus suberectus]|nr:TRANSPARENT TESTA protein 12 [Spatholobus suberectus]
MEQPSPKKEHNFRIFTLQELVDAINGFNRKLKIGEGNPGEVYRGHKESLEEVQFRRVVNHPNLVKLLGYCSVESQRGGIQIQQLLVYEFMPNRTLEDHLFTLSLPHLSWKTRLQIMLGAAQGLHYLHNELDVQVIYRHFRSSNVLLDRKFHPKLSDFSPSKEGLTGKQKREHNGGESSGSSSDENSPRKGTKNGETPLFNGPNSSMETTELHHAPAGLIDTNVADYTGINGLGDIKNVFTVESIKLWQIGGPIAFSVLCNYGVNSFTNIFVGHLGDLELSAVSISLSVISNFSFGFLLGMASALETLCGQAFGAGQVDMLGVYMQRSWIILFGACICILPIYIYAEPILILLGQERQIAELAGVFTLQSIPQMFSLAINFPTQKFLQAQSKVGFLAWLGFGVLLLHILILYILIKVCALGTTGAAAAYCLTAWIIALAQTAYVMGWCKDGWRGFSWLAFKDLWAFLKLSVASAVMLCLEVWYFMILIVLTGHLDNPVIAVGSLSICMNINGWEGMLFIGINAAISVRVSNELGSGRPRAAKYSVIVTIVESLIIGLLSAAIILITKDHFAIIFTNSKEMIKAVSKLAGLLGITMILNSIQPVISGVAVGGGWQALVAYINLFCYYIIGLPLGIVFGYKLGYRVEGIWVGMICGTALQTGILLHIVYKTNWNKEVEQASERMRKWTGQELEINTM